MRAAGVNKCTARSTFARPNIPCHFHNVLDNVSGLLLSWLSHHDSTTKVSLANFPKGTSFLHLRNSPGLRLQKAHHAVLELERPSELQHEQTTTCTLVCQLPTCWCSVEAVKTLELSLALLTELEHQFRFLPCFHPFRKNWTWLPPSFHCGLRERSELCRQHQRIKNTPCSSVHLTISLNC